MDKPNKETNPQPGFHLFRSDSDRDIEHKTTWLTGQKYVFYLDLDLEEQAHIKRWCEENCVDTVVYVEDNGWEMHDGIYFYLESDAAAFKLRWL